MPADDTCAGSCSLVGAARLKPGVSAVLACRCLWLACICRGMVEPDDGLPEELPLFSQSEIPSQLDVDSQPGAGEDGVVDLLPDCLPLSDEEVERAPTVLRSN